MYIATLSLRRPGYRKKEYFIVDKEGTLSTNIIDAMIFPSEEIADMTGAEFEQLYEGMNNEDKIIAACHAKKIDLLEFLRLRGKR